MNNPLESRRNYLKTLNDELLSKTQSDIVLINRHEAKRAKITLPPELISTTENKIQSHFHQSLNFEEDESVNIIGEGELFYKIDCRDKVFPLRVTFKKVKGQLRFLASFKHKYPNPQQADYNFVIQKDIRRALPARPDSKDMLYICFMSVQEVGMMKVYIDSYSQQMEKVNRARQSTQTQSLKVIKSVSLDKNLPNQDQQESNSNSHRRILLTPIKKLKQGSIETKEDFLQKNKSLVIKYKQVSSQKLIKHREKQQEKYEQSKMRREEIERYKQKNRELKIKTSESKEIIEFRKEKIKEEIVARAQLVKNLATAVELCKFFAVLKSQKEKYCTNLRNNARVTHFQSSFLRKLKSQMRSNKEALPIKLERDKANLRYSLCLVGWAVQNKNINKISSNIGILLSNYSLASKTNTILGEATEYRRKIRSVQKFWKLKYRTRLQMIEDAGKRHIKAMIAQFKQFKDVEIDFQMKGILRKITIEYVKDTTIRFNSTYLAYFKRLDSLGDIEKMNKNIAEQNLKLAKRNQKPLLRMPVIPSKPYPRYFRDLDSFKSMLRAWFQLQSKKYEKKQRKEKQMSQEKIPAEKLAKKSQSESAKINTKPTKVQQPPNL